uniref:Uncharacterized protein n=1 Tax=Kalanchoe fedtschenkoi TaxID=63787 RepID=A0A7N0VM49_KALFE
MEAASVVSRTWLTSSTTSGSARVGYGNQRADHWGWQHARRRRRLEVKTRAVTEVVADSLNLTPVDITWEIVVGSIAGATPFVVAGIEFSKRIVSTLRFSRCPTCIHF